MFRSSHFFDPLRRVAKRIREEAATGFMGRLPTTAELLEETRRDMAAFEGRFRNATVTAHGGKFLVTLEA